LGSGQVLRRIGFIGSVMGTQDEKAQSGESDVTAPPAFLFILARNLAENDQIVTSPAPVILLKHVLFPSEARV
jgi:hypothetical protein